MARSTGLGAGDSVTLQWRDRNGTFDARDVTIDEMRVRDELDDRMALMPGSVDPPTMTLTGQLIEWVFQPPTLPMTLSYRVRPLEAGLLPISKEAGIAWTDSEGLVGAAPFPDADVEVVPHTATPTSTSTPTSTPTNTPTPSPSPTPTACRKPNASCGRSKSMRSRK